MVRTWAEVMVSNVFLGKRTSICFRENSPCFKETIYTKENE